MRHDVIYVDDAPSLALMDLTDHRVLIRDWLNDLMRRHEASVAEVARRSGVGRNTIYRAIDEEALDSVTSTRTIASIAKAFGEAMPEGKAFAKPGLGDGAEAQRVADAVWETLHMSPVENGATWRLTGRTLELAGYLPGDLLRVAFDQSPQPGDVVCAQLYDLGRGSHETIFRLYEPPYLAAATLDRKAARPLLIDGERVMVRGVVVELLRRRQGAD